MHAEDVEDSLARAEALAAAGDRRQALEILQEARGLRGLDPEIRDEIERRTEAVAHERLAELEQEGDPKELENLMEMGLPRQLAVTAGVAAAERWLERGKPKKTVKLIRELDEKFPFHHERVRAGQVLFDAGYSMSQGPRRWSIFTSRDNGRDALEYLCDKYVSDPHWDEAAFRVGQIYEEDRKWFDARKWYEDLVFFRPESPLVPDARARVPRMRLASIASPEYDRTEILTARSELERWLEIYPDHELAERVRSDLADCLTRLWKSDMLIAHFYERNGKPVGARFHAERARETAGRLDAPELSAETEEFLRKLAEIAPESAQQPDAASGQSSGQPSAVQP